MTVPLGNTRTSKQVALHATATEMPKTKLHVSRGFRQFWAVACNLYATSSVTCSRHRGL